MSAPGTIGGRPGKVSFDKGGAFIVETRREVELYLRSPQTRLHARLRLYAKTVFALSLWAGSYATLVVIRPGVAPGLLAMTGLMLGMILVGFCVQHDANHGAYFRTHRLNHLLGWSADALLGFSSYVWRTKHNVSHHTYTNVDEYDDDITQVPFARFMPSQRPRPWYRLQHIYIWLLYAVMALRGQTFADAAVLIRGRVGHTNLRRPRGWDLVGLVAGKAIFVGWVFAIPVLVYPWWVVLVAYVGFAMVASLVIATTFQLAHCVEEAHFTSPAELATSTRPWAVHEVETTVDFCPRNRILTWFLGGLNYQIEHHLFPRLPHTHYPRIAEIVRRNASEHGVRYTVQPSLRVALASHQRHLRTLGRLGVPAEIEMG